MPLSRIVAETREYKPDAVLLGHSGSTSGHPSATRIIRAVRSALPDTWIVYGGVFPTYHWADIMEQEPAVDFIVRGEGEETIVRLMTALERGQALAGVPGIVFRPHTQSRPRRVPDAQPPPNAKARATVPAPIIRDLDACRVGWELIDHRIPITESSGQWWRSSRAVVRTIATTAVNTVSGELGGIATL
jgi:anaerobic magnesium-protoporphyrin IX monomethyl ester cyclase